MNTIIKSSCCKADIEIAEEPYGYRCFSCKNPCGILQEIVTTMTNKHEEMDKRFDEKFPELSVIDRPVFCSFEQQGGGYDAKPYVKYFIHSEVDQALEEQAEEKDAFWKNRILKFSARIPKEVLAKIILLDNYIK